MCGQVMFLWGQIARGAILLHVAGFQCIQLPDNQLHFADLLLLQVLFLHTAT